MAKRVAHELALDAHRVAHQIRYDATTGPHTQVKFMTDGVLLRELAQDLLLTKYSVIIVDEAHERSVNTDVLIGMLSRVVRLREQRWAAAPLGLDAPRPLRLVIMSATLRVGDFTQNTTLFPAAPPLIQIGARQHPVAIHFNRRTVQDYVTEAVKKASKIHARLPPGGILIFVTGQQEVATVSRKLQQRYGADAVARKAAQPHTAAAPSARDAAVEAEEVELGTAELPAVDEPDVEADPEALDSDEEEEHEDDGLEPSAVPMHVLPLYSLLPTTEQQRVFEDPPENTRLVVVATNVAETSITIPNIKYVVDTGRVKERHLDPRSQVQSYDIAWVSKASAAQRAGRAGRTGPGHCYRLYSSAVFEEVFPAFSVPEILRTPVDGLVLQMKAMNIDNVARFPFPTPPDRDALRRAERMLVHLGALEPAEARRASGQRDTHASITELGRTMALFPVLPRYAKLLAQGNQHGCLPYAVALTAALSVGDVFEREERTHATPLDMDEAEAKEARRKARAAYYGALRVFDALGEGQSDAFRLLSVVGAYAHEAAQGTSRAFCESHYVRLKAMEEIHQLRAQLGRILLANLGGVSDTDARRVLDPALAPPSAVQCKVLRQLLAAILVDRVAVRADVVGAPEAEAAPAARGSQLASTRQVPYVALGVQGPVYVHASSTFFHRPPPEWVVFGELHQSAAKVATAEGVEAPPPKVWLKMLTRINPAWLPKLGRTLCTFSQPTEAQPSATLGKLAGSVQSLKRGERAAPERDVLLTPRYGGAIQDGGAGQGLGWELPVVTAKQRYEHGRWVTQA
ncbi:RNA helicase [Malassezia obtusa]|uniref:RNA helicase n=1 Tax=Malassezia obtusa TaxID=76774 RepID=A0AAF0IQJ6_9BASI|nr:RNA helicase [Malassezia obtusa]